MYKSYKSSQPIAPALARFFAQCPMSNAQCPIPNAHFPISQFPNSPY
ncbi:MAG: hypothetical protein F6J93_25460 [Oscillatoria sp. SIO1A7]|nr:hypothetical protein [Oscillatoria sp. SIO1A7]